MATPQQIKDYINKVYPIAKKITAERRLPAFMADLCLTQGALESGYGTASVMVKYNALFGQKATAKDKESQRYYTSTTKEFIDGKYVTITAYFKSFDSLEDNINGYFDLMQTSRYAFVLLAVNLQSAFSAVKSAGYATAPDYAETLNGVWKVLQRYIDANKSYNYIVNTKNDNLNVRKSPDIAAPVLTSIPKGTKIFVSPWVYLPDYGGYVYNEYIKQI